MDLKLAEVNLITSLKSEAVDLKACKNEENLFSGGLESFQSSFVYKGKLVSKLREIFDNFKRLLEKNKKTFNLDVSSSFGF